MTVLVGPLVWGIKEVPVVVRTTRAIRSVMDTSCGKQKLSSRTLSYGEEGEKILAHFPETSPSLRTFSDNENLVDLNIFGY